MKRESLLVVVALLAPLCALSSLALSATVVSPSAGAILAGGVAINVSFPGSANVTIEYNSTGGFLPLNASTGATDSYRFVWNCINGSFPDGAYGLRVTVVNASDANDTATLLVLGLTIDNTPPSLSGLSLSTNHPPDATTPVTIAVNASDLAGVSLVQLTNGSSSVLMARTAGTALSGTYGVTMGLSVLGCQPDRTCTLTVLASDIAANPVASLSTTSLARPLYIDASAPRLLSNATNASSARVGDRIALNASWSDISLVDPLGFSAAFEAWDALSGSFARSSQFSSWNNSQLAGNATNATYLVNGSQEGTTLVLRVTLNDSNGRAGSTDNLSVTVGNVPPSIAVRSPGNATTVANGTPLLLEMLDVGVGVNLSSLRADLAQGALNATVGYAANASLFDCACVACGASYDATTSTDNVTCALATSWIAPGNATLRLSLADRRGNANAASYSYLFVSAPDIVNVTLNGQAVAATTPSQSIAFSFSNESPQASLGWSADADGAINATSVALADVSPPFAATFLSVPAGTVLDIPAGKSYARINVTLAGSSLADSVQLNLTANVPLALPALAAQYASGIVTSWRVFESGQDVTAQTRLMNSTFDIVIAVANATGTTPFSGTLNYSGLSGLALRWNASADMFAMRMANASEAAGLGDLVSGNVTLALAQAGKSEWFLDGSNAPLALALNLSLGNGSAYLESEGTLRLLRACASVPASALDANGACALSSGATTTLFLPALAQGDRVLIARPDARGPNVTIHTPASAAQSVVVLNLSAASPDLSSCAYNVSVYNASSGGSAPFSLATLGLSSLALDGHRWRYAANLTGAADGTYNVSVTCADGMGTSAAQRMSVTLVDTTPPSVSGASAQSVGSAGATIVGHADELANFSVLYGTDPDGLNLSQTTSVALSQSGSVVLSGLFASTTYYYNITACDAKGQCNSSAAGSFSTSGISSGGGGGGGGGGGDDSPALSPTATQTRVWLGVAAGDTIEYSPAGMAISLVRLHFAKDAPRVEVSVAEYAQRPDALTAELGKEVYRYVRIEHTGLEDADSYGLQFSVDRQWAEENLVNLSTVALYRLEGSEWKRYGARRIGTGPQSYSFEARPPGLSWFAITGDTQIPAGESAPNDTSASTPVEERPADVAQAGAVDGAFVSALSRDARMGRGWWMVALALIVVAGASVAGVRAYRTAQGRERMHETSLAQERDALAARKGGVAGAPAHAPAASHAVARTPGHDPMAQLHEYIARMRAHGHADDRIRERLLGSGWDEVIVDEEMGRA